MFTTDWHNRYNLNSRLKTTFRRKLKAFQKKSPNTQPFSLDDKSLAFNWWGKAWNAHLKNYTFKTSHLEKGKLHFRCEALADFKINSDDIEAVVLGSNIQPYEVQIIIEPIAEKKWERIQKLYDGQLESFEKILDHQFPKEMIDIFTSKPIGLLPSKNEIIFNCSCSDSMTLCKHAAVVLFALGVKIDENPQILFELRGVNILELISKSIHDERKEILNKAKNKSPKVLQDVNLSEVFNIEIQQK